MPRSRSASSGEPSPAPRPASGDAAARPPAARSSARSTRHAPTRAPGESRRHCRNAARSALPAPPPSAAADLPGSITGTAASRPQSGAGAPCCMPRPPRARCAWRSIPGDLLVDPATGGRFLLSSAGRFPMSPDRPGTALETIVARSARWLCLSCPAPFPAALRRRSVRRRRSERLRRGRRPRSASKPCGGSPHADRARRTRSAPATPPR